MKIFQRFQPFRILFAKNNQTRTDDLELIYFSFYGFINRVQKKPMHSKYEMFEQMAQKLKMFLIIKMTIKNAE